MPHECSFNDKSGVIEVRSYGDVSLIDMATVLSKIERLRSETGVGLVLVDVRDQAGNSMTLDISGMSQAIYSGLVIAYWIVPEQPTKNELDIIETLFRSHGCVIDRFTDRNDALKWLHSYSEKGMPRGLLKRMMNKLWG